MSTVYDEKLLDKVGLAMVPSGYTNNVADVDNLGGALGKVYSVLPVQTIGDNVVTNGTFDVDANWTKGTGWDIIGGKAVCDGTQTNVTNLSSNTGETTLAGGTYKITYTITRTNGTVRVNLGNWGEYRSSDGTYTDTIQDTNGGSRIVVQGNADFVGSVDNISVQLVSDGDFDFSRGSDATRVNSQGYIESVQVLSDELVQNGDFEEIGSELITNGDFSDGENGWNPVAGNFDIINGKAVVNHTNDTSIIVQSNVSTVGKMYRVEFTISDYVDGRIRLRYPFINGDLENNPRNGTFVYYGEAIDHRFELQSRITEDANYKVDNVSVKEVGQNWDFGTDVTVGDGFVKMDNSAALQGVLQAGVITNGSVCTVTFTVQNYISGIVNLRHPLNESVSANGTYTFTGNANDTKLLIRGNDTSNDFEVTNISVIEITDDTDIPRLDYTNAACPSLLLEPTRENLFLVSEPTSADGVSASSPESYLNEDFGAGLKNGVRLGGGASGNFHYGATCLSLTEYSMSFYIKREDGEEPILAQSPSDTNGDFLIVGNGGLVNTFSKFSIKKFKEDIYKVEATYTTGSQAGGGSNGVIQYSGNSQNFIRVTGFQIEQASYPTSYIPTNGLLVTRRADICNNAGDSTIFNDSEGVLFGEFIVDNVAAKTGLMSINDSSISNLLIATINTNKQIQIEGTGSVNVLDATVNTLGERIKIAFSYGQETAVFINGNKTSIEADVFSGTGLNQAWIGSNPYGHLEGIKCNSFFYFPEVLSDAELEYITSADIDLTIHNYKGSLSKISATYEDVGIKDRLTKLF